MLPRLPRVTQVNASASSCLTCLLCSAHNSRWERLIVLHLLWRLFCSWCYTNSCAAQGPSQHSNTATAETLSASHLRKHTFCSIQHDLFNEIQQISMIHSVCIEPLVQNGCLQRRPRRELLLLLCKLPGGPHHVLREVTRTETPTDKHTVPSPQTMACLSCPQPWLR